MNRKSDAVNGDSLTSDIESKNVDLENGAPFVYKIVDDIFEIHEGHYKQSESQVISETASRSSKNSIDRRLKYWKDMLYQRRALQRRLSLSTGKQPDDILFNLDYRNDFNELEVIGENRWHNTLIGRQSIHTISSLSKSQENGQIKNNVQNTSMTPYSSKGRGTMMMTLSVLINGTSYCRHKPEFSPILEKMFVCNPYEKSLRTIMIIENNGQRTLTFNWKRSDFFAYNNTLFNTEEMVFVFDTEPFELRAGEVREVLVLFQPSTVGITKQRWLLTTKPRIFFRCPMALTLNMHGRCKPPQEYLELLEAQMEVPIRKCRQLSAVQEHLKPPIRPLDEIHIQCPYARELEDCEAFNRRNVGFHCECDNDMEDLRNFFEDLKSESNHLHWDYSVSMLIDMVCSKKEEIHRIELFAKLMNILDKLRGRSTCSLSLSDSQAKLIERRRTKLIFVRGIIANNIDLWEEKIFLLHSQMLKASRFQESKRKLMYSKPFRDSIYLYTYDQLCNVVEDIVSVIESTELV